MGNIEELIGRVTIPFPRSIAVAEAESLFQFFKRESGLVTRYNLTFTKQVGDELEPKRAHYEQRRILHAAIAGDIHEPETATQEHFALENTGEGRQFTAMKFDLVPGWQLREYSPRTVQLWDQTRDIVARYFQSHK